MPSRLILVATLAAAALLAGCESLQRTDGFLGVITPYRIDIVQGNAITSEQVARLKPGMTRLQVREILGTPLLTDPFHAHRWDYVFVLRRPNTDVQRRGVVVFFEGDRMASFQATELPSEREFVASISRFKNVPERKLELTEEERQALPLPVKPEAAPGEPLGAVREYPPLEAS
jgi:outer membrane protein assembly factor BamE